MNYSIIRRTTGLVLRFEAMFLILPALTGFIYRELAGAIYLLLAVAYFLLGNLLNLSVRKDDSTDYFTKEGFISVAMVWIVPQGNRERLEFHAASDSAIVSGLIYLALRVYSGRPAEEILATEPDYIADIGLARHLSPTRSNGLAALLGFIRDTARSALA